jgi:hypothetical protein
MKKLLSLIIGLGLFYSAHAQLVPLTIASATSNVVQALKHNATNLVDCGPITVPHGQGVSVSLSGVGVQATQTTVIGCLWSVSQNGSNYSTAPAFVTYHTANGTTAVRDFTNLPPSVLNNARYVKLLTITNENSGVAAAPYYVTSITVGSY